MPRGDGTGPMGMGNKTGRAAGYCAGSGMPGFANRPGGPGYGAGFGRGRGFFGRWFGRGFGGRGGNRWAGMAGPGWMADPESERLALQQQAEALGSELEAVKKRLAEVEASRKAK